jgi:hypothetical protein
MKTADRSRAVPLITHVLTVGLVLGISSAGTVAWAQSGCDNGVPIWGTACKTQGDRVEYVCQPGSVPGNSNWKERSCNGGTCQGSACRSASSGGCDNGVPIGGTACKTQGDRVEYVCQPGSVPGNSSWKERSCNGGTCQGSACQPGGTLQRVLQVGGNYTDIGRSPGGGYGDIGAMRAEVTADLDRLHRVGVTDLRIWAHPPGMSDNLTYMKERVTLVAQEANKRGMTVTVTLIDVHRANPKDPETPDWPNVNTTLKQRYEVVVKGNKDFRNIVWSVGNEMAGPDNPERLATWYVNQVRELNNYKGAQQKVVAELVPGSVNHFEGAMASRALAAAKKIIDASHLVAVHYYPSVGAAKADEDLEFRSLNRWRGMAGTKFVVGEFGISEDAPKRYNKLAKWLEKFNAMGIRSVRLWQFLKNEEGHLDPWSMDVVIHQDLSPQLIRDGWLKQR